MSSRIRTYTVILTGKVEAMKVLTDKEFVAKRGGECPWCRSGNIEAGRREFDGAGASQEVKCLECEREWTEGYKLIGFSPVL